MRYRFVQDANDAWYLLPVNLLRHFYASVNKAEDFTQHKLTFHPSQYSFEQPVVDEQFTPIEGLASHVRANTA